MINQFVKHGVEKVFYFSAAISADSIHSQFDIPELVNKARVPKGFPLVNLGAWNDDPLVIQAIKEKIEAASATCLDPGRKILQTIGRHILLAVKLHKRKQYVFQIDGRRLPACVGNKAANIHRLIQKGRVSRKPMRSAGKPTTVICRIMFQSWKD